MQIFMPFPVDSNQAIHQRLSSAIGNIQNASGEVRSYIDIFNHDVEALNNILNKPPSLYEFQEEAFKSQQEYNWAVEDSKLRWTDDNINIGVGKSVIKNLSTYKKQYLAAKNRMQEAEQKSEQLLDMAELTGQKSAFWQKLDELARQLDARDHENYIDNLFNAAQAIDELDKGDRFDRLNKLMGDKSDVAKNDLPNLLNELPTDEQNAYRSLLNELDETVGHRQERLKYLRLDWQSQDIFVLADAKDLLKIQKNLQGFKQFLLFLEKSLSLDEAVAVDQKIRDILALNFKKLTRLENALVQAMSWRIHAAGLKKDIRFDDNQYAIIEEVRKLVFLYDDSQALTPVAPLLTGLKADLFSKGLDFETFEQSTKLIKESANKIAVKKWLGTKWVKDPDNENAIPVSVRGVNVVPKVLAPMIPRQPGWTLGSIIRYYFFQTTTVGKGLLGWLRKKYIGSHSEFLTLFNETAYQIKSFRQHLFEPTNLSKRLNLFYLSQSPAFKDAIEIKDYIEKVKTRGRALKPSWTTGVLFNWIPFLNRYLTYQFYAIWEKILEDTLSEYREDCTAIANKLIEDYEDSLFESIQSKVFLLPANLLNDIESFVSEYGDKTLLKRFNRMNTPINILKKFKFLHPPADDEDSRRLNEDNVHAFLTFAEKYWTHEQYQAAVQISKIILREWAPATNEDLTLLFNKTKILYTSKEKEKEFMFFLKYLAQEYIFLTGDRGDDDSLHFLKRFWPDAARNWESERSENLDDKFTFILSLVDVHPNFEIDLQQDALFDAGQIKLDYRQIHKYIQDIDLPGKHYISLVLDRATEYVREYQGSNNQYRGLILSLGIHQPELIRDYFKKRIGWLFNNPDYQFTEEDKEFYLHACKNPYVRNVLYSIISHDFNGKSNHLDELIDYVNNEQIRGIYLAKRLQYMMKHNSYQEILASNLFNNVANNQTFITAMNDYFNEIIGRTLEADNLRTLEADGFCHMIERFGSNVNKEAYRILRIKRLLELNDFEHIQAYVQLLLPYVKDLNKDLITTPKAKELLVSIYRDYVEEVEASEEWHAHVQYLLQYFSMDLCPELLHRVRLLWLKNYLFSPDKFSELASINRPTMDIRVHNDNMQIPNEDANLQAFYGNEINQVANAIDARLSEYSVDISENMLLLLTRYLKDPAIKVHDQHNLYRKKMEDLQRAKDIVQALKHSKYEVLFELLDHFLKDHKGQTTLLGTENTRYRQEIVRHQLQILKSIYAEILEHIKLSLLSSVQIFSEQLDVKQDEIGKIVNLILQSKLPEEFKEQLRYLSKNNERAHHLLDTIQNNLIIERLHELNISTEEALLLRTFLAKPVKYGLIHRVNFVQGFLLESDPLFLALKAFKDILMMPEERVDSEEMQSALSALGEFKKHQRRTDRQIRDLADEIVQRLARNESIADLVLFSNARSGLQLTFIQSLDAKVQQTLGDALIQRIQRIAEGFVLEEEQADRQEWERLSDLYGWLCSVSRVRSKFDKEVLPLVRAKLADTREYIQMLEHAMEDVLSGKQKPSKFDNWLGVSVTKLKLMHQGVEFTSDVLEQENHLIHLSLFVRMFGSRIEKDELDQMVQSVLTRLRRAMMQGEFDPFREHCIKFADKLVTLAGSEVQQAQCAKLMSLWNKFTSHDEFSLGQLKTQALEDSLPDFLTRFDATLYSYFKQKYNLQDDFEFLMRTKIAGFPYKTDHLDFDAVLHQQSLDDIKGWMKRKPREHKLQLIRKGHKVDDNAAKKLYIAYCLSLQAHQIAWILENRIINKQLNSFNVGIFVDVLTQTKENLERKLKFNSHSFDEHFAATLGIEKDYFVSWNRAERTLSEADQAQLLVTDGKGSHSTRKLVA